MNFQPKIKHASFQLLWNVRCFSLCFIQMGGRAMMMFALKYVRLQLICCFFALKSRTLALESNEMFSIFSHTLWIRQLLLMCHRWQHRLPLKACREYFKQFVVFDCHHRSNCLKLVKWPMSKLEKQFKTKWPEASF